MSTASGRGAFLLLLVACAAAPARGAAPAEEVPPPGPCHPPCAQSVFVVTRSLNQNELVYQANVTADGFHPKVPLQVYWVMKEKGGRREELTNLERNKAYGIRFLEIGPHEVRFSVKALEGVVFRTTLDESHESVTAHATTTLDGDEMTVERVFIATTDGGLFPKVLHIDFSGTSHATSEPVVHRVVPKGAPHEPEKVAGGR